jgi:hypothetical protein
MGGKRCKSVKERAARRKIAQKKYREKYGIGTY